MMMMMEDCATQLPGSRIYEARKLVDANLRPLYTHLFSMSVAEINLTTISSSTRVA